MGFTLNPLVELTALSRSLVGLMDGCKNRREKSGKFWLPKGKSKGWNIAL